ncbi:MAG TPA: hypothetical protein VK672_03220 [Solirubrobacteraceae bacterium]|jgi:hypothetical protein|nr:hypothetical protein [Solirubrobacteraceae bacterium]
MTAKERLHKLVDELTEAETNRALRYISSRHDPLIRRLDEAPLEDEEISAEEEAAVREARDELAAGVPTIPFEEIKRKYGLA